MTTPPGRPPARRSRGWIPASAGLALILALSACGSSGSAASSSAAATKKTCQQVAAVLADGPDPGADPAGYAEAQILPLRQIHAPDKSLKAAISALDTAYRQVFSSDGKSATATKAVAAASKHVNAICPGAAS